MATVLVLIVVDCGSKSRSGQIGMCCLSAKEAYLSSKRKDWLELE